jgi:hypothetical protein
LVGREGEEISHSFFSRKHEVFAHDEQESGRASLLFLLCAFIAIGEVVEEGRRDFGTFEKLVRSRLQSSHDSMLMRRSAY